MKAQPPAKYASPDAQVDGCMSGGRAHSRRRHTAALLAHECREHVQLPISTQPRCWQSRKLTASCSGGMCASASSLVAPCHGGTKSSNGQAPRARRSGHAFCLDQRGPMPFRRFTWTPHTCEVRYPRRQPARFCAHRRPHRPSIHSVHCFVHLFPLHSLWQGRPRHWVIEQCCHQRIRAAVRRSHEGVAIDPCTSASLRCCSSTSR